MLAVGLMSGTSLDGVDCALVEIEGVDRQTTVALREFMTYPMPMATRARILEACAPSGGDSRLLCSLHAELGHLFSRAVGAVCAAAGVKPSSLGFVASHGQTIWHEPDASRAYEDDERYHAGTLQLGDAARIAWDHNVRVVYDFRAMDMAAGGQGAPLVPFSETVLYGSRALNRVLLNVGGIGNVTVLPKGCNEDGVFAFDTGPGNMAVDEACRRLFGVEYDDGGCIAARGRVNEQVLADLMSNEFFSADPPKSTGREMFGAQFVEDFLRAHADMAAEDVVATLTELTALSVVRACEQFVVSRLDGALDELIVGGGGAHNATLMARIAQRMPRVRVCTQDELGYSSDAKEAIAFAVMGNQTIAGRSSNVPSATGASARAILGSIINPPRSE